MHARRRAKPIKFESIKFRRVKFYGVKFRLNRRAKFQDGAAVF